MRPAAKFRTRIALILTAFGCGLGTSSALAQSADEPFKGRTVTITIGFSTGGNYDLVGRLVARHIGKQLPGQPSVVPVNMPGAGSIRAANFVFAAAPKDGTALGILSSSIALEEALGTPGITYRSAEFNWIGRVSFILQVLATLSPSKARTIADVLVHETPMGATGPGSPSEGYPKLLNALIGTKFKIVTGYSASTDVMLAMDKGEVDGGLPSWNNVVRLRPEWLREKRVYPLVQWVLQRAPELPDVPTSVELGKTLGDRDVLAFYTSSEELGRSITAPPGIAPERVEMLRRAFDRMLADADFLAEIQRVRQEFNPLTGEQMQKLVADTARTAPEVIARTKVLVGGGK